MIKSIIIVFRYLVKAIIDILHSKYRWLLLLYIVWLFRVDFITADAGYAQGLQVFSVLLILFLINREHPHIVRLSYKGTSGAVKALMLFYSYALMSTLWSFLPTFSFFIAFQTTVFIMALVWLFSNFRTFEEIETSFLMLMIGTMLFETIFLRLTWQPALMTHHLASGSVAAMCFSYCIGEYLSKKTDYPNRRKLLLGSIVISLFVLVTSTSSGANASAVLGMGVGLVFSGHLAWAILAISVGAFLYYHEETMNKLLLLLMPGKTKSTIDSASGRKTLWELIFRLAKEKPLFGWGHASVERAVVSRYHFLAVDAHNSYYGIYGSLGIVGCVLAGYMILRTYWSLFVNRINPGYVGLLSAFSCGTLNGYSYGFLSGKTVSITIIYLCIIVLSYYYAETKNEESAYES